TTALRHGVAVGGVTLQSLQTHSAIEASTLAYVDAAATVTAGSLSVTATANTRDATARSEVIGIGGVAGADSATTADVAGNVEAYVGSRAGQATTLTIDGAVAVAATSAANPDAEVTVGAGGVVASGAVSATANAGPTQTSGAATRAYLGTATWITRAGDVSV